MDYRSHLKSSLKHQAGCCTVVDTPSQNMKSIRMETLKKKKKNTEMKNMS